MSNEHTEYNGEVDVPVEAILAVDPNVVASMDGSLQGYLFLVRFRSLTLVARIT